MSLFNSLIPSFGSVVAGSGNGHSPDIGPSVKPAYEVKETDEAFGLTVYLPGVSKDGLDITAESDQLRIAGRRAWKQPEEWTALYRESPAAPFELASATTTTRFNWKNIHAELRDGVLRLSLPKSETIKPRKIAVT